MTTCARSAREEAALSAESIETRYELSILLVVPDDPGDAQACLQQLGGCAAGVNCELLVSEGERPHFAEVLRTLGDAVRPVAHPAGASTAAAWNEAARQARAEGLLFLEPHALPTSGALTKLVEFVRVHPDYDAVGAHTLGPSGEDLPIGTGFASAARLAQLLRAIGTTPEGRLDRRHLPVLGDGCLFVRAAAFAEVGGFDPALGARAALLDLCLRLVARGRRIGHQPASLFLGRHAAPAPASLAADSRVLRRRWGVEHGTSEDALWVDGREGMSARPAARVGCFCDDPERRLPPFVEVGHGTYFVSGTRFLTWTAEERVAIGNWCSFARDVTIFAGGGHSTDTVSTYPFEAKLFGATHPTRSNRSTRDTRIGHDVWVGDGAVIGGGVHVGDGAVIATGSVVMSDVPAYAIVAGNPAQVLRYRFSRRTVEALLRIRWWEWPEDLVRDRLEWFFQPIGRFVARFDGEEREDAGAARAA
ncbi:MAG: hypothetical protein U0704_01860 [Candidatus Eisenbacteria bacterium]